MATLHAACFVTPRPWSALEFAAMLAGDYTYVLTAPHGFLMGRTVAGEAELLTLAVAVQARRQGTARGLVTRFVEHAFMHNATEAFLEVAADNAPAIALYAAAGFKTAGLRRAYYARPDGTRINAIIMSQRLTPRPTPDF